MGNLDLLEEACAPLDHTTRAMFGGHGFFAPNGGMFAGIVDDDRIMLKFADDAAREELCALGGAPWTYREKMTMAEWIVIPDRFYDEPRELAQWAARAWKLVPPKRAKKAKGAAPETKKAMKAPTKKPAKKAAKKPAKSGARRPKRA